MLFRRGAGTHSAWAALTPRSAPSGVGPPCQPPRPGGGWMAESSSGIGDWGMRSSADESWVVRGPQTIFQNESFRITFPSANSSRSTPRTSTRCPARVVPVSVHSDTPEFSPAQRRSSP